MANHYAKLDWLSLIDSPRLSLGTNQDEFRPSLADGDIVLGLGGDDSLASAFDRTALIGGNGDDTLMTGGPRFPLDQSASSLVIQFGEAGNDTLYGYSNLNGSPWTGQAQVGQSDVLLDGGSGNDVIETTATAAYFSNATASTNVVGGSGNDTINAIAAVDHVAGDSILTNTVDGGSGDDHITAYAGTESDAYGGSYPPQFDGHYATITNKLFGGSGNDVLDATSNAPAEVFAGSRAENYLDGGAGHDVLTATVKAGTLGSSFLNGGAGNDQLTVFGGSANILDGGEGKDTLTSGTGNDSMFGGTGADTFSFAAQNGHDTADFEQGRDIIDLTALAATNINDFGDLNIEVAGSNFIIHFDANNSLTVMGVNDLTAGDFWFA